MRIFPINTYNQTNFKSKVKQVYSGSMPDSLKDEVDKFEESHKNASVLGEGLFARAYLLNGTNYVIKETLPGEYAKSRNGNFFHEAKMLAALPESIANTQRLVAHAATEKNNYYLISTLVPGEAASHPYNPWSSKSMTGLFDTLFQLDAAGIYHNDVNQANCLIDEKGQVGAIDYQFARKFSVDFNTENSKEFKTPPFMMPANVQMFEMASLPWYFRSMNKEAPKGDMRKAFGNYLEAKSVYAMQRAMYLEKLGYYPQKMEYELLQSKYYTNPTDDMIDLQAKKLQMMYGFRKTFSIIDPEGKTDKNIASAPSAYISTAAYAKDLIDKAKEIKENTNDSDLKKFMDYEIDFGKYWRDEMLDELSVVNGGGVWSWIERNARLQPAHDIEYEDNWETMHVYYTDNGIPKGEDLSGKFKASEEFDPESIQNVGAMIARKSESPAQPIDKNNPNYKNISTIATKLTEQMALDNKSYNASDVNDAVIQYEILKQKFIALNKKALIAANNENYNAAIPNAIMAVYYGSLAQKALTNFEDKDFKKEQEKILDTSLSSQFARASAMFLINCVKSDNKEKALQNIGNFGTLSR